MKQEYILTKEGMLRECKGDEVNKGQRKVKGLMEKEWKGKGGEYG